MFDHVALGVSDFAAAGAAYRPLLAALGHEPAFEDHELVEWADFDISPATDARPVTRGLHVGFKAPSREAVDAFWRAGLEAGFAGDGEPGPRPRYGAGYYGGFLRDADGNSIEACVHGNSGGPGLVDHVWIRVADLAASLAFYTELAPYTGFAPVTETRFRGGSASFTLVAGTPVTEPVHIAFTGEDVEGFHAAALAAGYRDNGAPGPRPEYSERYYAAFVLDPDDHNIEVVRPRG